MPHANRRDLLKGVGLAAGGLLVAGTPATGHAGSPGPRRPVSDPFTLGVASGDPRPDGFVLWTRLAPEPLADNGLAGMPDRAFHVEWQIARDERFRHVVRRGISWAVPEWGHSVHVDVRGLKSNAEYFYRFRCGHGVSPTGRTRTTPVPHSMGALTMCFASCGSYTDGYFTAYRRLAEEQPDLVLFLGDYIYEGGNWDGSARNVAGGETYTLADYRRRYAQYKTDPDLQFAHATAPWTAVPDDHEVDNNWAGDDPEESSEYPLELFPARRAAALKAYWENMPLPESARPAGGDWRAWRTIRWGRLASFHMLDTRTYRDDQADAGSPELDDPNRTIIGPQQEAWLSRELRNSRSRWDLLGQQVWFSQVDYDPGPGKDLPTDTWDGYQISRSNVVEAMAGSRNPVVLTGDVHSAWAMDIKENFDDPDSRTIGVELTTTSITSGGDGTDAPPEWAANVVPNNSHVHFGNGRRGYVRTRIEGGQIRADFRVLPYVTTAGAEASTVASYVTEDRNPGLQAV